MWAIFFFPFLLSRVLADKHYPYANNIEPNANSSLCVENCDQETAKLPHKRLRNNKHIKATLTMFNNLLYWSYFLKNTAVFQTPHFAHKHTDRTRNLKTNDLCTYLHGICNIVTTWYPVCIINKVCKCWV